MVRLHPVTSSEALLRAILLAAALLLAGVITSGCAPKPVKLCNVTYDGIKVSDGLVTDTVHAFCDQPPQSHVLKVQLEYSVGGQWIALGRTAVTDRIPGPPPGFPVTVQAECHGGTWHTVVHAEGTGPDGKPFVFDDKGAETAIKRPQCAE